jgi:hypothetical protein
MTVEEKAYNYASKVAKNRLTASEVAAHYGRGYIEGQEDMRHLAPFVCVSNKTWHPASELPQRYKEVIVICKTSFTDGTTHQALGYARYTDNGWDREDVKWWCYPPEED